MSTTTRGREHSPSGSRAALTLAMAVALCACQGAVADPPIAIAEPGRAPTRRDLPPAPASASPAVPDLRPNRAPALGPKVAHGPGAGPLAGRPALPDAWPTGLTPVVATEYERAVIGAAVRALAFDSIGDTLLAFDAEGGLRRRVGEGPWRVMPAPFGPGLERVESAGRILLACAGESQPARWSTDAGDRFVDAGFTCGEAGRRTAVLVDGQVYALLGPDTLGVGPAGGEPLDVRPVPGPALALAVLPPRLVVFGPGAAWRSEDDGRTFAPVDWPAGAPAVREAHFLAKAHVVAVGDAPAGRGAGLALSLDGGRRFAVPALPRHTEHLAALAALDARVIAVPAGSGEAVASEDDAATFDLLPGDLLPGGVAPRDAIVAVGRGFVAGAADRGVIGLDGASVAPLDVTPLRSVVFPHPRIGFGIDAAGRVRESRDGGSTWGTPNPPGLFATGLARLDADYGLVLGTDRGLFRFDGRTHRLEPLDPTCASPRVLPLEAVRREAEPAAMARCADARWRWLHDGGLEPVPVAAAEFRAVAVGEGGRPAALSADGHTLFQLDASRAWRTRAIPATVEAVDLGGTADGLTLLFATGERWSLTRFEGAFHARTGEAGPGRRARGFVPLPGGAALMSAEDDILYLDGAGGRRIIGAAPGAMGVVSRGDGAWFVLQTQASTLFLPR